jgi:hypothetical protein
LRIAVDECFEDSVLLAPLAHVHLAVAQKNVRVDDRPADGAHAARQLIEDFRAIKLNPAYNAGDGSRFERHVCFLFWCGTVCLLGRMQGASALLALSAAEL